MDYKLPDGSGLDIAEQIRSKCGAAPIILISGYDPSAVALRAEKLGISDFLEKPFSRETILSPSFSTHRQNALFFGLNRPRSRLNKGRGVPEWV
jgi:FixJ family two-component response regulator